jgi:hypothetical protein
MRKLVILSVVISLAVLAGSVVAPAYCQSPATDDTPTFYRLVPGTYVNGWPRFTITYPKDWVERLPNFNLGQCFGASTPRSWRARVGVHTHSHRGSFPLERFSEVVLPAWRNLFKDTVVVSDEPSRLRDGTPAREIQIETIVQGSPRRGLFLGIKKDDLWIQVQVVSEKERWGDDLSAIAYSLNLQPDADKPVKVPADVQELFDKFCRAVVARDLTAVMTTYSERFRNSGLGKGERELFHRSLFGSSTSCRIDVTDFVPAGDIAHLAGYVTGIYGKGPLQETSIIKENGEWKWYGNQRNPAP